MHLAYAAIKIIYHYSQFLGSFPLEYNNKKDKFEGSRRMTIYTFIANAAVIVSAPFLYDEDLRHQMMSRSQYLHQIIFLVMGGVRSVAVVITIVCNWYKRRDMMKVIDSMRDLKLKYFKNSASKPELLTTYRCTVIRKLCLCTLNEISSYGISVYSMWDALTVPLLVRISIGAMTTSILNLVMMHSCMLALYMNYHFELVNTDLRGILKKVNEQPRYAGGYIRDCCQLADNIDTLAVVHRKLIQIVQQLYGLYNWQIGCVLLNVYLSNVAATYMIYTAFAQKEPMTNLTLTKCLFIAFTLGAFYFDLREYVVIMLRLSDVIAKTGTILKEETPISSFDRRLERSFKTFSMQIAKFPYIIKILGLFEYNRLFIFAMIVSTLSHSIVLVQYDYQHY